MKLFARNKLLNIKLYLLLNANIFNSNCAALNKNVASKYGINPIILYT